MTKLLLFVEGDDDQRFIERVTLPLLTRDYELVKIQKVAQFSPKDICKLIKAFEADGWDYLFIVDKDEFPCISGKRDRVIKKWTVVKWRNIIIVDKEIESWYISGIDALTALDVGFTLPQSVEGFTKEHLDRCVNKRYPTATDLKLRFLDNYSITTARERSSSFAYLISRLLPTLDL